MKQEIQDALSNFSSLVTTGGYDTEGQYWEVRDAITTPDALETLGRVYTSVLQDVIDIQMVGTRLIQTLNFSETKGISTHYTWVSAGNIPDVRVGESGEYPEFSLSVGTTSSIRAQFQKYGLVVKVTQEQLDQSQWDVIRLHITEAGKALARAKEKAIFNLFNESGVVVFDNDNPTSSIKGVCTGRDRYGNPNGAITQEDLFEMYCQGLANGYMPNVILVHPLAFPIFQKDPILRNAGYDMYNPREFINSQLNPIDSYKNSTVDTWRKQQRKATGTSQTLTGREIELTTNGFSKLPSYSPLSGVSVITSHMVEFDPVSQTTSIIMIDTGASGVLNQQKPLTVDSWEYTSREIIAVRIKEAYSIDVIDKGRGILVAKNVPLVPNEFFYNPVAVINDLAPIP